jgi:hypothetical protein
MAYDTNHKVLGDKDLPIPLKDSPLSIVPMEKITAIALIVL